MRFDRLHSWPKTASAAIRIQERLAGDLEFSQITSEPELIAGVDCAFSRDESRTIAGVVVWRRRERGICETRVAQARCTFPYIPGLLSFRELPAVLSALSALRNVPDVVLCDAQGLAHPRAMGLACHLGLWLNLPTIGCAKSRLCGEFDEPGPRRGQSSPLLLKGRQVGVVLRTRDRVKPLFVSPGHRCDIESATRLTLEAAVRYRLPEPTRLAHQLVTQARNE
ncbi:MAG: endonuclease V [Planctomycetes bacterium]|nr:endonuclease V [Planctomycetota bacterium]